MSPAIHTWQNIDIATIRKTSTTWQAVVSASTVWLATTMVMAMDSMRSPSTIPTHTVPMHDSRDSHLAIQLSPMA